MFLVFVKVNMYDSIFRKRVEILYGEEEREWEKKGSLK